MSESKSETQSANATSSTSVGDLFQMDVEPFLRRILGVSVVTCQKSFFGDDAGEDGLLVANQLTQAGQGGFLKLMNQSKRNKVKNIDSQNFETDMLVKVSQLEATALEDLVLVHDVDDVCDIKEDLFLLAEFGTTSDRNVNDTVAAKMCQLEKNITFFSLKHDPVTCAVLVTTQNVKTKCLAFLKKNRAHLPRLHALMIKARFFNYFRGNSLSVVLLLSLGQLTLLVEWSLSQREHERDAHVEQIAANLDDQAQQIDALRQHDEQKAQQINDQAQQINDQARQIQELRAMMAKITSK
jgi:hypothetical protein